MVKEQLSVAVFIPCAPFQFDPELDLSRLEAFNDQSYGFCFQHASEQGELHWALEGLNHPSKYCRCCDIPN